jgi:hypothetical protein
LREEETTLKSRDKSNETDEEWAERMARGILGKDAIDSPEWTDPKFVALHGELCEEFKRDKVQPSARLALFEKLRIEWATGDFCLEEPEDE